MPKYPEKCEIRLKKAWKNVKTILYLHNIQLIIRIMTLQRKIDKFLCDWKKEANHLPLIIKGARQIGKTYSICKFGNENYKSFININFILQPEYQTIFDDGYEVEKIIRNISFINPAINFLNGQTLILFDELQRCPQCATALKSFALDQRFDVICSGSLMGLNYREIESNAVGYKNDIEMYSLDFEEFLWAKGYDSSQIEYIYDKMRRIEPLSTTEFNTLSDIFRDYMVVGGMPAVIKSYIEQGNFSKTLQIQTQLLIDYREDITKYAEGLDKAKILAVYDHISTFLAKDNKKFQITKIGRNSRNRDYVGVIDWLASAGIVNVCYNLQILELPLKGNYNPDMYKLYYQDTGLLVASLDQEAQEDLRKNRNFGTYKGALFENIVGDMLRKQGYNLFYFRNEKSSLELDFILRDMQSLVPIEVKAGNNVSRSLVKAVSGSFDDIKYGIKLANSNIGFNGKFFTFPYFCGFLLRRFLSEEKHL